MQIQQKMTVGFVLTAGAGYDQWKKNGTFERELAIYWKLAAEGWTVRVFSYNRNDCHQNVPEKVSTHIVPFAGLPRIFLLLRQLALPFVNSRKNRCDVLITNQAHNGGWTAVFAAKVWRAKSIARCGYVFGEWVDGQKMRSIRNSIKKNLEKWSFKLSDRCIIPTMPLVEWVVSNYHIDRNKIARIPNFVMTDQFKPDAKGAEVYDVIHVGRLSYEKRPLLILEALKGCDQQSVLFVGDGPLKNASVLYASENNIPLKVMESVTNSSLPELLNQSKCFVIASIREGHPKALVEAMACGCVCIGADRPGINTILTHNENGLLFDSTAEGLRNAIADAQCNPMLIKKIKLAAREYAIRHYAFEHIYQSYVNTIKGLHTR